MSTAPLAGLQPLPPPGDAAAGAAVAGDTLASRALPAEAGVWDELRGSADAGDADPGQGAGLRAPWQRFAQGIDAPAGTASDVAVELDRRVAQVATRIRLDGVTHNVLGDAAAPASSTAPPTAATAASGSRPWPLALLPLLLEPADWAAIEAGVVQRATLLQRVLADLYGSGPGSQTLLHEGLLPPALLLRHPGWLRQMVGASPPGGLRLFVVAFDLARGPDGRWWLLSQRTQGPSGLGYVLHNRLVVSRQFPEAFRGLRVQHLASSYRRLLDTLEQAAAQVEGAGSMAAPRIVLLTPGPYSETYFEHAYLARYLGLPLVEGGDLTVRDDRLFLKTVEGLEPVHGLLRRLDDDWCDPLELRSDSALGVPGLLRAARAGSVVMANTLGSAFLESPAVLGFLPAIARRLLGSELLLPSLPTWWCGEAAARRDVAGRLGDKVVRSTFPADGRTSQIHAGRPANWADSIADDPDAWTVQGRLAFSRAPIWGNGAVVPRPATVRVYAIADAAGGWHVLPGGMTRVSQRAAEEASPNGSVSLQRGGTSLDTWVLTEGVVDTFSMLPQRLHVDDIAQRRGPVSSRTGENLFWLGRYTERTEQLVRLAKATLSLTEADAAAPPAVLQALSALAVSSGLAPPGVPTLAQGPHLFQRALLSALGSDSAASVAFNLAALERAAGALRERLTPEHAGLIRNMREDFASALHGAAGSVPATARVLPALDRLALQLAAATGAQTDRMTRDHGWRLLAVGRLAERLLGMTAQLHAFVEADALAHVAGTELLLELFDSLITFRARYQRHEDLLALADLLVLDTTNPRAFAGVLRRLRSEIGKLPGGAQAQAALLALLPAEGAGLTLDALRDADDDRIAQLLLGNAAALAEGAATLADSIGTRFFTLAHGADHAV